VALTLDRRSRRHELWGVRNQRMHERFRCLPQLVKWTMVRFVSHERRERVGSTLAPRRLDSRKGCSP